MPHRPPLHAPRHSRRGGGHCARLAQIGNLDTRDKIIETPPKSAAPPDTAGALFVVAWFDPMLAAHATRTAELSASGRSLVIVIADPPDPILPARARAALAASLDPVSRVL